MQVNKNVIIRSLRFENTNIYPCSIYFKTRAYKVQINRQIYNAVKIKTTEGFPSSLAFIFFAHLFAFVRKTTRKVIKNLRILDGTQAFSHQISNSKRVRTKFELKGKSVKMLGKFKQ